MMTVAALQESLGQCFVAGVEQSLSLVALLEEEIDLVAAPEE